MTHHQMPTNAHTESFERDIYCWIFWIVHCSLWFCNGSNGSASLPPKKYTTAPNDMLFKPRRGGEKKLSPSSSFLYLHLTFSRITAVMCRAQHICSPTASATARRHVSIRHSPQRLLRSPSLSFVYGQSGLIASLPSVCNHPQWPRTNRAEWI